MFQIIMQRYRIKTLHVRRELVVKEKQLISGGESLG